MGIAVVAGLMVGNQVCQDSVFAANEEKLIIKINIPTAGAEFKMPFYGTTNVSVNWGDGNTQTVSRSSTGIISTQHHYNSSGKYVISVGSSNTLYLNNGYSSYPGGTIAKVSGNSDANYSYSISVKKVEIGSNIEFRDYALAGYRNLESITLPENAQINYKQIFNGSFLLKHINIPKGVYLTAGGVLQGSYLERIVMPNNSSMLGSDALRGIASKKIIFPIFTSSATGLIQYSNNVREVVLPEDLTSIPNYFAYNTKALMKVKIPSTVTSIGSNAFAYCPNMSAVDFTKHTNIPTVQSNTFDSNFTGKIVVPDSLYETWIATTGWDSFASHIIKESDYED